MMLRIGIAGILLFASAALQAAGFTQDDMGWLKKMATASRHTEYGGTFIYQSGSYIETSRITHVRDGENEYERLEGLDGERSEIIRKNNQIWCFLGDGKVMVAKREGARTFPALLPEQYSLLQENYLISRAEDERVAGFQARSVIFQPRDKMRYAHKMWAHQDSGLLLKAVVLDEHARIVDQYAFTQLQIGGELDRKWIYPEKIQIDKTSTDKKQAADDKADAGRNMRPTASESGWVAHSLPAGFRKIAEVSRYLRGSESPVVHLVYSDGLAGISVFIEKTGQHPNVKQGLINKGVVQVFSKIVDGNMLTVVGEVPSRTVMQVAESVRFSGVKP